jgi:hypothetical protein
MSDDDRLHAARLHGVFADILQPPPHGDPLPGIHRRVGRAQHRRTAAAAAVAVVALAGAGVGVYTATRPAARPGEAATQVVTINPRLNLDVAAAESVAVGAEEQVTIVLTGTGEPADTYGWRVSWGDGGLDRVFGSSDCRGGSPAALDATRIFAHHYLEPGPERIIVELTRCGTVQARSITQLRVTRPT